MTRDDVRAQFPEATEEQITAILNINGGDIQNAKKNSVDPKEMKRLQEIEEKYTKLTNDGLTDEEKIQQALDAAKEEKAKYLKSNNKLEVEKIFMQAGVSPDEYEKYIDSIVSEDAELSKTVAQGIADNIKAVKEATEKEVKANLLKNMPDLGGNGGSGDPDEPGNEGKTEAEKVAKELAATSKAAAETSKSVLENYL